MDQPVRRRRRDRWTPIANVQCRHRDERLLCPVGGTEVFGRVPEIRQRNGTLLLPGGEIFLRYGHHLGPHRGFGFVHIWKEHVSEVGDHEAAVDVVRDTVARALRPGTGIHYENGDRVVCFRPHAGVAVLELRQHDRHIHYSVVTSGFNPPKAKGPRIGALS